MHPNLNLAGEDGWFFIFLLFKSILFFVNWISLYLIKYYNIIIIIIIIAFWLGSDRPSGLLFSCPLYFFPHSCLSSYHLHRSVSLSYIILAIPIQECLGKHMCRSSPFPIAILNCTFFFSEMTWSKWSLPVKN